MPATSKRTKKPAKRRMSPAKFAKVREESNREVAELHERLNEAVTTLASSEGWTRMLQQLATGRLTRYSFRNVLLILAQCPHATAVGTVRQWNERGRLVRKGAPRIRILKPMTIRERDEDGKPVKDEDGKIKTFTIYRPFSVWDISETVPMDGAEAPDVPELGAKVEGSAPADLWDRLTSHAAGHGYTVETGPTGSADGYTEPKTRTVRVRDSDPEAHRVVTLAHEVAHIECGHVASMDEYRTHRGRMETEAESVAYIVCGTAGLDAGLTSVPYIAQWAGKTPEAVAETLTAVGETVLSAVRAILTSTDPGDEAQAQAEAEAAPEEAADARELIAA